MDSWSDDQIQVRVTLYLERSQVAHILGQFMQNRGNKVVNRFYNPYNLRPSATFGSEDNGPVMEKFIREKYEGCFRGAKPGSVLRGGQESIGLQHPPRPLVKQRQQSLNDVGSHISTARSSRPEEEMARRHRRPAVELTQELGRVIPSPRPTQAFEGAGPLMEARDETQMSKRRPAQEMDFPGASRNARVILNSNGGLETATGSMGLGNPGSWSAQSPLVPGRSASTGAVEGLLGNNPVNNYIVGKPGKIPIKDSWGEMEARQDQADEYGSPGTQQQQQQQQQQALETFFSPLGPYHQPNLMSNNPFRSQMASPSSFDRSPTFQPAIQRCPFTQSSMDSPAYPAQQSPFQPPADQPMDKTAILALYKLAPPAEASSSNNTMMGGGVGGSLPDGMQPIPNNQSGLSRGTLNLSASPTSSYNPFTTTTLAAGPTRTGAVNTTRVDAIRHSSQDSAEIHLKSTARHSIEFFATLSYQSR